ncbi:MAG: hypothetical protein HOP29_16335 [Phycisphaerales bacterium]|nr:hypothetical protein [Phycisphaerales bacterium]
MKTIGLLLMGLAIGGATAAAGPVSNEFTYQGQLKLDGRPLTGTADLQFSLYDAASGGSQFGVTVTKANLSITDGLFTVQLDFGASAFSGDARWLQIAVRSPTSVGQYTVMTGRQPLTAAPYALYALAAPGSAGGGGTLDAAYDFGGAGAGRQIVADSGAVNITGAGGLTVSGDVGFGTTSPAFDLHVQRTHSGGVSQPSVTLGARWRNAGIGFDEDDWYYLSVGSGNFADPGTQFIRKTNKALRFGSRDEYDGGVVNYQMTLTGSGNLGIGTETPVAMLHINDNTDLSPTGGGVLVLGSTSSANLVLDGNEIMARNNGSPTSLILNMEGGNVGIGVTPSASARLHVQVPNTDGDSAIYSATYGGGRAGIFESHQSNATPTVTILKNDGPALRVSGEVSATNAATDVPFSVIGGTDASVGGGGFAVLGSTNGSNLVFDNNEIVARTAGLASTLYLNHTGGTVAIGAGGSGSGVGIGTATPKQQLHVTGSYYGLGHMYLHALEGDGASGTAYIQARDDSTTSSINLRLRTKQASTLRDVMTLTASGRVGVGTTSPATLFDVAGTARCDVLQIDAGSDLSEGFTVTGEAQPGMVVAIDPSNPGQLMPSAGAYDRRVAGIVSGAGGISTGMIMGQKGSIADGDHPIALTGRVYCWCDASNGPIQPGDMLTTSDLAGHAMKVTDFDRAHGAVIGKAMTSLESGAGLVLVLVNLQ